MMGVIFLINKSYIDNMPDPKSNILHDSVQHNLTNLSSEICSQGQINNLILNSNLDNLNVIK